tara:strand:- start:40 stop:330 length:291 start_codon:yes stop_codon:yes gene_type:complete
MRNLNDKQWQDSSDGWVKTMNESKARKEKIRSNTDYCSHDDFEFCENCQYDENGEKYDTQFDNYEPGDWCMLPDSDIFDKHIDKLKELENGNTTEK